MSLTAMDEPTLYQKVAHLLQHGLRTTTYKVATLSALIDFCVSKQPSAAEALEVPLDELARRVFAAYWPQTEPYGGIKLRQSTQSSSRIFDSIEVLRSASDGRPGATLADAIRVAPQTYQRAIDNVVLVLAQQPLPRLQRVPGAARSLDLLFDDSFLNDNVTRHDLAKHRNAIVLHVGRAAGLSKLESNLQQMIRSIWVDDVIRINRLPTGQRVTLARHLFGVPHGDVLKRPGTDQPEREDSPAVRLSKHAEPERIEPAGPTSERHDRDTTDWGVVVGPGLGEVAALCDVRADGCWIAPSNRPVRCRPPMDTRSSIELPKMPLHRWAWLVDNYRSHQAVSPHIIHIHRRCSATTCCNPEHLYPAAPGGAKLTHQQVDALLNRTSVVPAESLQRAVVVNDGTAYSATTTVLTEDLAALESLCVTNQSGCWISPTTSSLPCRASGDDRPTNDLPRLSAPRWAWKVANDQAAGPLPGSQFQVWKRCSNRRCCNPEHLYITGPDGRECTVEEAKVRLEQIASSDRISPIAQSALANKAAAEAVGRHRARPAEDDPALPKREEIEFRLVADRLNSLIGERDDLKGDSDATIATSLQQDGLAVSASLIARLRTGSGPLPSAGTLEALAYFFNVDGDYFASGRHSDVATGRQSGMSHLARPHKSTHRESPTQRVEESPFKFDPAQVGVMIGALSNAISHSLTDEKPDIERARHLAGLITKLSSSVEATATTSVDMDLVQQIIDETTTRLPIRQEKKSQAPETTQTVSDDPLTLSTLVQSEEPPTQSS